MFEILPLYGVVILLAYLSHISSGYNYKTEEYIKKEKLFYGIIVFLLVIFAGTRTEYNDTWVYRGGYNDSIKPITSGYFDDFDWTIGHNPGFHFLQSLIKTFGFNDQSFIMIFAFFTVGLIFWFYKKYTNNIFYTIFIAMMLIYIDVFSAMKQMLATAICLLAVDRLLEGKKIRFVLWVLIAVTIHPYAIMYLICPFMLFKPWTRKTWYLLIAFGVFGLTFQFLSERIIILTSLLGEEYTITDLSREGMHPVRVIVQCVPIFLSVFVRDRIKYSEEDKEDNLFLNLSMLSGELSFVALFGTALLIGRLANYFLPFQALSLPWLLKYIDKRYRLIVIVLSLVLYFSFFVADGYLSGNGIFDDEFSRMTLFDYLEQGIFV